jgi:hypothetical protein
LAASPVGVAPKNLTWAPTSGNAWNTTATNFNDGSSQVAFRNNDSVTFSNSGLSQSTVQVAAEGVNPKNIAVTNTTGTYTFTGGPIGGSGILTKTNAGQLVLGTKFNGSSVVSTGVLSEQQSSRA